MFLRKFTMLSKNTDKFEQQDDLLNEEIRRSIKKLFYELLSFKI